MLSFITHYVCKTFHILPNVALFAEFCKFCTILHILFILHILHFVLIFTHKFCIFPNLHICTIWQILHQEAFVQLAHPPAFLVHELGWSMRKKHPHSIGHCYFPRYLTSLYLHNITTFQFLCTYWFDRLGSIFKMNLWTRSLEIYVLYE